MKINGAWKEGTPYLKEGGIWKEVRAVTAKANGKWADIAPPKPVRTWTLDDFIDRGVGSSSNPRTAFWSIKPELRQYFIIGDTLELGAGDFITTPIPGASSGNMLINGGVISGKTAKTDALIFKKSPDINYEFMTQDLSGIPIADDIGFKYTPRTWVVDDFDFSRNIYYIKSENRQFFMIGDSFDFVSSKVSGSTLEWIGEGVPGLILGTNGTYGTITGTITGGTELTNVMSFKQVGFLKKIIGMRRRKLNPNQEDKYIPIKPAP